METLKKCLRAGTLNNVFVPVLTGTAFKNKGVQPLLDAVVDFMPSPIEVEAIKGVSVRHTVHDLFLFALSVTMLRRCFDEGAQVAALSFGWLLRDGSASVFYTRNHRFVCVLFASLNSAVVPRQHRFPWEIVYLSLETMSLKIEYLSLEIKMVYLSSETM